MLSGRSRGIECVVELIGWESSILALSLDIKQETTRNFIDVYCSNTGKEA